MLCLVAICYLISWALDIRYRPLKWLPLAHALPILSNVKYLLIQMSLSKPESLQAFYQIGSIAVALGFILLFLSRLPTLLNYISGKNSQAL